MPLCHYCKRLEATHGYIDIPASQHCDGCSLVRILSSSVSDIRCRAQRETSIAALAAAMRWEHNHAHRGSVIVLLSRRAKALGYRLCVCGDLITGRTRPWCRKCSELPRDEHGLPIWTSASHEATSEKDFFFPRNPDGRGFMEDKP